MCCCRKQRKAERKANWEAKQKAKSDAQKNKPPAIYEAAADDGPTPEELRRREMRSGRFARGASDQSGKANVPVYAVRQTCPSGLSNICMVLIMWRFHCESAIGSPSSRGIACVQLKLETLLAFKIVCVSVIACASTPTAVYYVHVDYMGRPVVSGSHSSTTQTFGKIQR